MAMVNRSKRLWSRPVGIGIRGIVEFPFVNSYFFCMIFNILAEKSKFTIRNNDIYQNRGRKSDRKFLIDASKWLILDKGGEINMQVIGVDTACN